MSTFDNYPKYQLTKHGKVINNILRTAESFFGMNYEFTDATINDGFPKLNGTIGGGKKIVDEENTSAVFESQLSVVENEGKLVITTDKTDPIGLALSNYATKGQIEDLFTGNSIPSEPTIVDTPEVIGQLTGQTLNITVIDPTTTRYKHEVKTTCVNANSIVGADAQLITTTDNAYGTTISLEAPEVVGETDLPATVYPYLRSINTIQEGNKVTTQDSKTATTFQLHFGAPVAVLEQLAEQDQPYVTIYAPLGLPELCNKLNNEAALQLMPKINVECKKYYYPTEDMPEGEVLPDADGRYPVALDTPNFNISSFVSYPLPIGTTITAYVTLEDTLNNLFISNAIGNYSNFIPCPAFGNVSRSTLDATPNTLIYSADAEGFYPRNCFINAVQYAADGTVKVSNEVYIEELAGQSLRWDMLDDDRLEITFGGDYYNNTTRTYTLNDFT